MNRKSWIVAALVVLCLTSCGSAYYSRFGETAFSNEEIRIGDTKESIIKRYGKPYSQEMELVDGKTVETLGYKESMLYGYKINTFFVFEDGKLVKKLQSEEKPRPEIKVDKE